ncbi:MAG: alpha/beta hydrolase family protein [Candidatus Kapaibacteriota bacterium]
MKHVAFELHNTHDTLIHGEIRMPEQGSYPVILLIHGFRGSKDWGFFPYVAQCLSATGAITITWNMSLNGYSAHSMYIDKPDEFAKNTITEELSDTQCIIDALLDTSSTLHSQVSSRWNGKIYIMGHSRGAGIAMLIAEKNPAIHNIALWNPISRFGRFTERQKQVWKEKGIFQVDETQDGIPILMKYSYIEDLELHGEEYSLMRSIISINSSISIVHAEQDMTVPLKEALALKEQSDAIQLQVIPATGHVFGCTHPFTKSTLALDTALHHTTEFFDL